MSGIWKNYNLIDLCDYFNDGNWIEAKDQSTTGIRLIQTGNIGNGIYLDKPNAAKYISEDTFKRLNCSEVYPNDILISRLPKPVGRACIVPDIKTKMITAVDCTIVRVNKKICDYRFLLFSLMNDKYFNQVNKLLAGSTRERISRSNLESVKLSIPSLEEQERIVKIIEKKLNAAEKAKTASVEQKKIASKLFSSFLQNIISNKDWKVFKLEEISQIIAGQSPNSDSYNFDKIGLPFFQGKADFGFSSPTPKVWCSEPIKIAEKNDILLSVRAPVGPTNITSEKSCIGRGLCAIRVNNNINYKFVYFFFKLIERKLSQMGNGSTFSAITNEDVKTLEIYLPPLEEQERIVNIIESKLNAVEKSKSLITEQSSYINALPSSILRKAFNGNY